MNVNKEYYINKIKLLLAFIFLINLALIGGCSTKVKPITRQFFALNTICSITIYDDVSPGIIDKCIHRLKEIENKMSVDISSSEVSKINIMAGLEPVKVSDDTFYVISTGKKYSSLFRGRFDISVGPLVKLWGISTPHARVPSVNEIKYTLMLINYKNIILNSKDKSVMLLKKGMSLDLGGIAKGFAGDAVKKVLKDNGVKHAIIDLGGNVLAVGNKVDGSLFRIGVQNPNDNRGSYFGVLSVKDKAVVTSGIYERYFIKNGKRYHHIMDTRTGYPVNNELSSVTIVNNISMDADALAKVFTLGVKTGLEFVSKQKNVQAIFVTKDNKVYLTSGLKNNFEITDSSFKLCN